MHRQCQIQSLKSQSLIENNKTAAILAQSKYAKTHLELEQQKQKTSNVLDL